MAFILIHSKRTLPCHERGLCCSHTGGFCIVNFDAEVNAELTANGDDLCGTCTLLHDFETVLQRMQGLECPIALFACSFAHCTLRSYLCVRWADLKFFGRK